MEMEATSRVGTGQTTERLLVENVKKSSLFDGDDKYPTALFFIFSF
jgi:hypothetical protein